MAKNLGRKFATMSEDERRRYALEEDGAAPETPEGLEFGDPRNLDDETETHRRAAERRDGTTGGK